jgi:thiol:disulfide interchange protein
MRIKAIVIGFFLTALAFVSNAQILEPVKWKYKAELIGTEEAEIILSCTIEAGWHVYACKLSDKADAIGPIPTTLKLDPSPNYELVGKTKEGKYITHYDPNFEMDLNYFENTASFSQKIKIKSDKPFQITGALEYMACNDERCIFPDPVKFKISIKPEGTGAVETAKDTILNPVDSSDMAQSGVDGENTPVVADTPTALNGKFTYAINSIDLTNPLVKDCGSVSAAAPAKGSSLWQIFVLGFLGGLVALLTPCVFPMIPLTVSFFTKGNSNKKKGVTNAMIYGLFIFLIYVLLSLPFHFLDQIDPNILNNISTNVWLNVFFFAIFVVFAISFFGYFEITLPASLANKMDNASEVGGLIGSFFMALTLAIVSFSCTGPILGSLLAGSLSKDGGAIQLTAGMGGFGLALGIPFAVFAAFPGMLKSLPKSGGWLNSVKVVLGFAELALAIKFLSNADLVDHWGFLKYEVFIGAWVIIFIGMALYLFGKIKFPHDSPLKKLSFFRISFGVMVIAWVVYLASGFRHDEKYNTYHSLTALSGLAPPVGYSWLYPKECPHNLDCEHDYQLALERAKRENKPLFVDFTGYACVNCRKMEEHVWIKPEILDILREKYIVVSLYVDDRKELPAELRESFFSQKANRTTDVVTYGDRWAALQVESFNSNSQPLYCLLTPDEKLLKDPVGYTPDSYKYKEWLECGLSGFETWKSEMAMANR